MRDTDGVLRRVGPFAHLFVAVAAVGISALGAFGVIGAADQSLLRQEHFDAKQVTVWPAGGEYPNGVRIREVVDIDFGLTERRGYQRIIPHDFGEPVDIEGSSPDANGEVNVVNTYQTRIRIGNPSITFTGQHRYLLEYTLPEAQLDSGELALDIIGHDETFVTDAFTVVVTGFGFTDTRCDVGDYGAFGGCELERNDAGAYEVVIEPLAPGDGITVGGPFVERSEPRLPDIPDLPGRNPSGIRPLGLVMLVVAGVVAVFGYQRFRHLGSNEVYGGGGAADAAFGTLPVPQSGDPVHDVPTHRVPDGKLADLATVEFVPPRGLEPWHGRALLRERVDDDTVSAWFSEMVAQGAMTIEAEEGEKSKATLTKGDVSRLSAADRRHVDRLFRSSDTRDLGEYDAGFRVIWESIEDEQEDIVRESGWWDPALGAPLGRSAKIFGTAMLLVFVAVVVVNFVPAFVPTFPTSLVGQIVLGPPGAILLTVLAMMLVVSGAYGSMRPSRTAVGSALTLRTESFRRFLASSEGRHVDWAWEHGLIREYSAWAVALDAADAWSDAIESSNVPDQSLALSGPLMVHSHSRSFSSAHTQPSSSGSGGGFSGGSGGGGGGGSSGSW